MVSAWQRTILVQAALMAVSAPLHGEEPGSRPPASRPPLQGVLVDEARVTPAFLQAWKRLGVTDVVVQGGEQVPRKRWEDLSGLIAQAGMKFFIWLEVARSPSLAATHPAWMASPGGHHNDWRRRFPRPSKAGPGEVVKLWPWVPIGYQP